MKATRIYTLLALLLMAGGHGLQAQNTDVLKYFNLVMPDHSLVSYELGNVIEIHFQDSIMTVKDLSFYMGEGVKYFFSEEDLTVLNEHLGENDSYVSGNSLYVKIPREGSVVISDITGRVVYSRSACKECVIDLSVLSPNTMYVIKVNDQTIKFVRR